MLASQRTRYFASMMYSDQIAVLYLVTALYLICWNRPVVASVLISLSVSLKSEALNIIPAFLAVLLLNFGVLNFVKSLLSMIALQLIFLAPFLSNINLLTYIQTVAFGNKVEK